jgi:BMFP domain-containing protein YqiC
MIQWLKDAVLGLATIVLKTWAPDLLARLLAEVEPADIAERVKPALRSILAKMDPVWRPSFARVLRLLAQTASEIAEEAESYGGAK